jgi:zinc protease
MPGRFHDDYFAADLLSDVLGRGQSSRLYNTLVKEKEIFTSLSSFVMGTLDPGLLAISGRVKDGIAIEQAEDEVQQVVNEVLKNGVEQEELEKVKNQSQTTFEFDEVEVMNRAMNLAFASLSGDVERVNKEREMMNKVSTQDIMRVAEAILTEENASVMYYKTK